nr:MAG TPA: hypothetical protein [Caudoviricetes sp.]
MFRMETLLILSLLFIQIKTIKKYSLKYNHDNQKETVSFGLVKLMIHQFLFLIQLFLQIILEL